MQWWGLRFQLRWASLCSTASHSRHAELHLGCVEMRSCNSTELPANERDEPYGFCHDRRWRKENRVRDGRTDKLSTPSRLPWPSHYELSLQIPTLVVDQEAIGPLGCVSCLLCAAAWSACSFLRAAAPVNASQWVLLTSHIYTVRTWLLATFFLSQCQLWVEARALLPIRSLMNLARLPLRRLWQLRWAHQGRESMWRQRACGAGRQRLEFVSPPRSTAQLNHVAPGREFQLTYDLARSVMAISHVQGVRAGQVSAFIGRTRTSAAVRQPSEGLRSSRATANCYTTFSNTYETVKMLNAVKSCR